MPGSRGLEKCLDGREPDRMVFAPKDFKQKMTLQRCLDHLERCRAKGVRVSFDTLWEFVAFMEWQEGQK